MLEESPGSRITTAALARHVGVSEAALYRHFPSKAKMIEGLIEFMEASVFTRISRILEEESSAEGRCRNLVWLLLSFAERNPGFARLLAGDALQGETDRLRTRMRQFFDRLERSCGRFFAKAVRAAFAENAPLHAVANLLLAVAEGRINQFVRSEFKAKPTFEWTNHWSIISGAVFPVTR